MSVSVTFMSDDQAQLLSLQGDAVVLRSRESSAPGSRPPVVLRSGERLRAKIHRCRRVGAEFELTGRMLDMTKAVREALTQALETSSPCKAPVRPDDTSDGA